MSELTQNLDDFDVLKVITENALSIRQLPITKTSSFSFDERFYNREKEKPNQTVTIEVFKPDFEYYEKSPMFLNPQKALEQFYSNYPDGRKFIVIETQVEHGGFWMCKQVTHTSGKVDWSKKTDNLAPTLEQSVKLWLENNTSR